jgi:hypothetical protein
MCRLAYININFTKYTLKKFKIEHLKRIHPKTLNPIETNNDDPDNQLQGAQNTSEPSISASSSLLPYQTSSSQCSEPPSKRSRQLTLFGSKKKLLD